jgi:polysaccharide export outer membrane protein
MSAGQAKAIAAQNGVSIGPGGQVQLPPGMTMEQARDLARQNGATIPAGSSGQGASETKSGIPKASSGDVDASEGEVEGGAEAEVEGEEVRLRGSRQGLRWGQSIFRFGNPSQAASHVGAIGPDYAIGPGDEIILTLWGQKEARYTLQLDRDGQVAIELVGVVSLNGQTLGSAEALLRKRLTKIYRGLEDGTTQMDVTLGKLKQVRIYVVGDAVKPGSFLLSGNTSVLAALFQARGPSNLGTERQIEIRRGGTVQLVDLYDYLARGRRPSRDILQDGDLLRIPRKGKVVQVSGDVGRPGSYELLEKEGAKDLLQYAGGINSSTANASVSVLRMFENGRRDAVALPAPVEILKGSPAALQDGDMVRVYGGVDPSKATLFVEGQVRYPGAYPHRAGLDLQGALEASGGATSAAFLERVQISRPLSDGSTMILRHDLTQGRGPELQPMDRVIVRNRFELTFQDSVRISGAVRRPGRYLWEEGMTAKDLILMAGGFQKRAEFGLVRLETPVSDSEKALVEWLQLDSALSSAAADHPIFGSAHLAVPFDPDYTDLEMVTLRGWVVRPGAYALQRPDERISEVVARAGGVKRAGYVEGAKLLRGESGGARIQVRFDEALSRPGTKHDLSLRGGDVIEIPKRPATIEVRGRVNNPGLVVWQEGKKWSWYISQVGGLADSAHEDGIYVEFADGTIQTTDDGIKDKPNPGSVITVPFRKPPEPATLKDVFGGANTVLATVIAGLTIFVLLQK